MLFVAAAGVLGYHLWLECATLGLQEPMGYPEVVYKRISDVWPHQYQFGHFVDTQDNYGPSYATFCRPFLWICGDAYVAARLANLAALSIATLLVAAVLRLHRASWAVSAAVASIFFCFNAGSSSIQARPDFLGSLTIVAALAVGQPSVLRRMPPVTAGAVLGLLSLAAYFTKPYCVLVWGAAVAFPALQAPGLRNIRRSLVIGLVSAAVIAVGIGAFAGANPYFLLETVLFHYSQSDPDIGTFFLQMRDFGLLACGMVALCAFGARGGAGLRRMLWPDDPDRRYWNWCLGLGAAALVAGLGWHKGAYLTYYYHLVLPPLAVIAGLAADGLPLAAAATALGANCAVLMILAPQLPPADPDWIRLAADVASQPGPIVVDYMLDPLARGRADIRVAGNGINRFALDEPSRIGGHAANIGAARREAAAFVAAEKASILKGPDPKAIYMDCYLFPARPGDLRVAPNGYLLVPRNEHPLLLDGYDMSRYAATRLFVIHPFYGSQNRPRQEAGKWISTIVKFVPRAAGVPSLPFVLVPAAQ